MAQGTEFLEGSQAIKQVQVYAEVEATFIDSHGWEGTERYPLQFFMGLMEKHGPTQGQGSVQKHTARAQVSEFPLPSFLAGQRSLPPSAPPPPRQDSVHQEEWKSPSRMEDLLTVSTWAHLLEIHGHRFQFSKRNA